MDTYEIWYYRTDQAISLTQALQAVEMIGGK